MTRLLYGPGAVYGLLAGLAIGASLALLGAGTAAVFAVMGLVILWAIVALAANLGQNGPYGP